MQILSVIEQTTDSFLSLASLLSQKDIVQLKRKSPDQPWSILDILEHILIVEEFRVSEMEKAINKPTQEADYKTPLSFSYNDLIEKASDRETKVKAPDYSVPRGSLHSISEFEVAFKKNREQMQKIVNQNNHQVLSSVTMFHARMGSMGIDQWIVYLCGHAQKHEQQILEILS